MDKKQILTDEELGELIQILPLFLISALFSVAAYVFIAIVIYLAGKHFYSLTPEQHFHVRNGYCKPITYGLFFISGIATLGLSHGMVWLYGQPLLIIFVGVGVTLLWAKASIIAHEINEKIAVLTAKSDGTAWATGHMEALRNLPRPFNPEMATEEELRDICAKLKMKRLDSNVVIDSWVDNMSVKEIQHKYEDFKHVEYDAVRMRITRAQNKVREFMTKPP